MTPCDGIRELLTGYALGDLDAAAAGRVREHAAACEVCAAELRTVEAGLAAIRGALAATSPGERWLSAPRRARVLRARDRRVVAWFVRQHTFVSAAAALALVGVLFIALMMPGARCARHPAMLCMTVGEDRQGTPYRVPRGTGSPAVADGEVRRGGGAKAVYSVSEVNGAQQQAADAPDVVTFSRVVKPSGQIGRMGRGGGAPRDVGVLEKNGKLTIEAWDRVGPADATPGRVASPAFGDAAYVTADGMVAGGEDGTVAGKRLPTPERIPVLGRLFASRDAGGKKLENTTGTAGESNGRWESGHTIVDAPAAGLPPGPPPAPVMAQPPPAPVIEVSAEQTKRISVVGEDPREGRRLLEHGGRQEGAARAGLGQATREKADTDDDGRANLNEAAPAKDVNGYIVNRERSRLERLNEVRQTTTGTAVPAADPAVVVSSLGVAFEYEAKEERAKEKEGGVREKSPARRDSKPDTQPADQRGDYAEHWGYGAGPVVHGNKKPGRAASGPVMNAPPARETAERLSDLSAKPAQAFKPAQGVNPFKQTADDPFSTFAMDVDTASYTMARNLMLQGLLPAPESVRTEEFVNFFDYAYTAPARGAFAVHSECAPTPFSGGMHLLKIGVKARQLGREERRIAVLTVLVDTSGSMNQPDRIGLVKQSLRMLVERLAPDDRLAIIQYDSTARLVLEHTRAAERDRIMAALDALQTSGSTNLEEGMKLAYATAARGFAGGAMNRVLLLSDGAANLGADAAEEILRGVKGYRDQGIYCSIFGFGVGTYNDEMLKTLADKGDGAYVFVDSADEAQRVFVDELAATLNVVAKDAKIQVEFNPRRVAQYRQLGYERRQLKHEEFRDDAVDAGEVGSGQSVTVLYELELKSDAPDEPIGMVRARYRDVQTGRIEEMEAGLAQELRSDFDSAAVRFRLAAAVAEFAEILRGSPFAAGATFEDVDKVLRPVALELRLDKRVGELQRLVAGAKGMGRGE